MKKYIPYNELKPLPFSPPRFLKMFGVSALLVHVSSVSFAPNVGPG